MCGGVGGERFVMTESQGMSAWAYEDLKGLEKVPGKKILKHLAGAKAKAD